jgi:DNA repair protein RadC
VRAPTCRSGPRERLESRGPGVLSDSELVALLLRTGSRHEDAWSLARHLLEAVGGLRGLESSPAVALEALPGVGPAKAASLRAAIELGRRWVSEPIERGQPFRSPLDVQRHYEPRLRGRDRESFHVVMLDGRHRLMLTEEVSVGTLTASLVHPREVFRQAIRSGAAAILLVHNHPSGDPSPSAEDRAVTRRLRAAGELVGIRVVDHVIVGEEGYYSFRESEAEFDEEPAAAFHAVARDIQP